MIFETLSQYKKERHHLRARLKVVEERIKQLREEKERERKKREFHKSLDIKQWQIEEALNGRR